MSEVRQKAAIVPAVRRPRPRGGAATRPRRLRRRPELRRRCRPRRIPRWPRSRPRAATPSRSGRTCWTPAAVDRLFQEALGAFGRIDVVVNSAGIMPIGPIAESTLDAFDRIIATNLRGTFLVLSQAAKHVGPGGRIIAFSSSVIAKSFPGYGPYIASKAGVEGLVRVLANELRGRQITVNGVAPGPVATELFLKGKTEDADRAVQEAHPARAPRAARGRRRAGLVPGRPRGRLGQCAGASRQRRLRVSPAGAPPTGTVALITGTSTVAGS